MATKKKPLRKAQTGIYKGDPGFTITPDSATTKKALKSDPGFTITPKGKVPKIKTSKDGYLQYKKGGAIKSKSKKK